MTILTVKNQLVSHFLEHDTFDFSRHALDIEFDKEVVGFREDMLRAAFAELEQLGLVKKMTSDDRAKEIWVLVQPLMASHQQVVVGPFTADVMGNLINHYNEIEGIETLCDKTKIDEGDILRLVQIIQNYEEFMEKGGDDEDESGDETEGGEE